jgi:hypothetical protein
MKKSIGVLIFITILLPSLMAQEKSPDTKSAIGFFSGYNKDGTIMVAASYKVWKCEVKEKKQAEGLAPGDLIEFEFYMGADVVVIVKLVNYKKPTQEEFERISNKYQNK